MLIRCPKCEQPLAERHGDMLTIRAHIRGGMKREIETTEARITCEKCGTTTVWQGGSATASAA
jgi:transposase